MVIVKQKQNWCIGAPIKRLNVGKITSLRLSISLGGRHWRLRLHRQSTVNIDRFILYEFHTSIESMPTTAEIDWLRKWTYRLSKRKLSHLIFYDIHENRMFSELPTVAEIDWRRKLTRRLSFNRTLSYLRFRCRSISAVIGMESVEFWHLRNPGTDFVMSYLSVDLTGNSTFAY